MKYTFPLSSNPYELVTIDTHVVLNRIRSSKTNRVETMLMKLAIYNEKKQMNDISSCCIENNSEFIPIENNIFAISDITPHRKTVGKESGSEGNGIKNETFVKIYRCLLEKEQKKIFFKHETPYSGVILDNKFFLNILLYCRKKSFRIKEMSYETELDTHRTTDSTGEINEVIEELKQKADLRVVKVAIDLQSTPIHFTKRGYVEIASQDRKIEPQVVDMIKIGFNNNVVS